MRRNGQTKPVCWAITENRNSSTNPFVIFCVRDQETKTDLESCLKRPQNALLSKRIEFNRGGSRNTGEPSPMHCYLGSLLSSSKYMLFVYVNIYFYSCWTVSKAFSIVSSPLWSCCWFVWSFLLSLLCIFWWFSKPLLTFRHAWRKDTNLSIKSLKVMKFLKVPKILGRSLPTMRCRLSGREMMLNALTGELSWLCSSSDKDWSPQDRHEFKLAVTLKTEQETQFAWWWHSESNWFRWFSWNSGNKIKRFTYADVHLKLLSEGKSWEKFLCWGLFLSSLALNRCVSEQSSDEIFLLQWLIVLVIWCQGS